MDGLEETGSEGGEEGGREAVRSLRGNSCLICAIDTKQKCYE
jgi:hypothetical protein